MVTVPSMREGENITVLCSQHVRIHIEHYQTGRRHTLDCNTSIVHEPYNYKLDEHIYRLQLWVADHPY